MTYVTKTQHENAVKMILGAVLATKEWAAMTDHALAAGVGTSPWAVRRCGKTLRDSGLLGKSVTGTKLNVPRAPEPTWVDFHCRLDGLRGWIRFQDECELVNIPEAIRYEVTALFDLLHTEGSLRGIGYTLFKSRLEKVEDWSEAAESEVPASTYAAMLEQQTTLA